MQTPDADVIDHGTEFGVEVTKGVGSEIHVFQGEVEVKSRTMKAETLRLFTDQATRVDEVDGSPAGITVAPDRFLRSFDEPSASYAKRIQQLDPVMYFRMAPSSDGLTLTIIPATACMHRSIWARLDNPCSGVVAWARRSRSEAPARVPTRWCRIIRRPRTVS